VQGTWNLHDQLSKTDLDFFILLSSASGVIGNRAQAAYSGASTYLDAFALYRQQLNLPAISLDLGVVLGVGYVAENKQVQAQLGQISLHGMTENELLALIKVAIDEQSKSTYSHQLSAGIGLEPSSGQVASEMLPFWANDPKFSHLRKQALSHHSPNRGHSKSAGPSFRHLLQEAKNVEEAARLITEQIARKVAAVMGIDTSDVRVEEPLSKYGVDSLAAVELRNWLWKEMKATVRLFELLADFSIRDLAEKIAMKLKMVKGKVETEYSEML
jgi:acyl carrier protein